MSEAKVRKAFEKTDALRPFITKTCEEIKRLDERADELMKEAHTRLADFTSNVTSLSQDQRTKTYKELMALLNEGKKLHAKKFALAEKQYDTVDENITFLDNAWASFVEEHRVVKQDAEEHTDDKKRKSTSGRKDKQAGTAAQSFVSQPAVEYANMPVDPNEPRYCSCNQVSYGEMVMCENKSCKTEWFHFPCVGLTEPPVGKWYCDKCLPARKKKGAAAC